ncbi:ribosomal protein S16 [Mycoplasmopsis maculosa]|uniref:Small ribosomal subunit protein bS16 n=1 Tax=Mycoplasmopsis maculosa TaxID=114885 RepID=A0A449B4E2_9BACT|nr:30S ribosomal protein S16 [Mycoplasmopsis maculosa]VEU75435.1 ribosomal protein S16 [Mycoplasmopsis maculosa]
MVKIRLKRLGSKFNACYKIVVADARAPRDGRFIEAIGEYNPHTKAFRVDEAATQQWIKDGAQVTQTVYNLFRTHGLNKKFAEAKSKENK